MLKCFSCCVDICAFGVNDQHCNSCTKLVYRYFCDLNVSLKGKDFLEMLGIEHRTSYMVQNFSCCVDICAFGVNDQHRNSCTKLVRDIYAI